MSEILLERPLDQPTIKPKRHYTLPRKPRGVPSNQLSHNARAVALDVIAKVRAGQKVNMQEIQLAHGYSRASAKSMKATRTRTYKEEMSSVVSSMSRLRDKTIKALDGKDLNDAKVFDLNLLLKNLNHDLQLLQGKSTQNIATATQVVVFGSSDFLALQMAKRAEQVNEG